MYVLRLLHRIKLNVKGKNISYRLQATEQNLNDQFSNPVTWSTKKRKSYNLMFGGTRIYGLFSLFQFNFFLVMGVIYFLNEVGGRYGAMVWKIWWDNLVCSLFNNMCGWNASLNVAKLIIYNSVKLLIFSGIIFSMHQ